MQSRMLRGRCSPADYESGASQYGQTLNLMSEEGAVGKTIEVGVFVPTVQAGWIPSVNNKYSPGSFEHVLKVVQNLERLGYDFVLSPENWQGGHGPSEYWENTVQSMVATTAFLYATSRIKVWGTCHVGAYPPALTAKIMASLSEVGRGRVGLNVVTGGHYGSLGPMGLWTNLEHDEKYDMADEWITVVKKLWTEDIVDHDGEFYQLFDARLRPRPVTRPTIVNAGASPRGLRFAVENCDIAFMLSGDEESFKQSALQAVELAKELNKPDFKTYGLVTLIPGETDSEAQALMDHLEAGADLESLAHLEQGYKKNVRGYKDLSSSSLAPLGGSQYRSVMPGALIGSYDTLVQRIAETVETCNLGGLLLIVPDYFQHLDQLATRTFPKLLDHGIKTNLGA